MSAAMLGGGGVSCGGKHSLIVCRLRVVWVGALVSACVATQVLKSLLFSASVLWVEIEG